MKTREHSFEGPSWRQKKGASKSLIRSLSGTMSGTRSLVSGRTSPVAYQATVSPHPVQVQHACLSPDSPKSNFAPLVSSASSLHRWRYSVPFHEASFAKMRTAITRALRSTGASSGGFQQLFGIIAQASHVSISTVLRSSSTWNISETDRVEGHLCAHQHMLLRRSHASFTVQAAVGSAFMSCPCSTTRTPEDTPLGDREAWYPSFHLLLRSVAFMVAVVVNPGTL